MQSGPLRVGRFAIVLLALYVVGLSSFSVSAESAGDSPKTGDELVTVEVAKSRSKRALWNFGSMIACVIPDVSNAITAAFRYNNYGCWCGTGGSGNPVDEIDHCCRTHDRCYDRLVEERCRPKTDHYTWSCRRGNPTCRSRSWWGGRNNRCERRICECDRAAVRCFRRYNHKFNKKRKCERRGR